MIRTENEYKKSVEKVEEEKKRLLAAKNLLQEQGLTGEEITRAIAPIETFHLQLQEEVESYERLKRGEFEEMINLRGFGHLLVSLRIAQNITQKTLADKLGVSESQISRDERNEYHGITLDRANKILEALGTEISSKVNRISA